MCCTLNILFSGLIDRRSLNFQRMFGTGTMHSKFLIADQTHFYLGSANLDWRSLNQVCLEDPVCTVKLVISVCYVPT